MNRRSFVAGLAALPALLFDRPAEALPQEPESDDLNLSPSDRAATMGVDPETMYTDVGVMLADIAAHTKRTGDIIINADNPHRLPPTLGFWAQPIDDGPGVGWSITIPALTRSLDAMEALPDPVPFGGPGPVYIAPPRVKAQLLRLYLKSAEGRAVILRTFPGQRTEEEHAAAQQRWLKEHGR